MSSSEYSDENVRLEKRRNRQTDGRKTVTLRLPLDATRQITLHSFRQERRIQTSIPRPIYLQHSILATVLERKLRAQ